MKNEQLLCNANIPKEWRNDCYITDNNMIFTPQFDENNVMLVTGKQAYYEWSANKDKPAQPTELEQLKQTQAELFFALANKGVI